MSVTLGMGKGTSRWSASVRQYDNAGKTHIRILVINRVWKRLADQKDKLCFALFLHGVHSEFQIHLIDRFCSFLLVYRLLKRQKLMV